MFPVTVIVLIKHDSVKTSFLVPVFAVPFKCQNGYSMYKICPGRNVKNEFQRSHQFLRHVMYASSIKPITPFLHTGTLFYAPRKL